MTQDFNINRSHNTILLSKDNQSISISKGTDEDIWFGTANKETSIVLNLSSREFNEWQTFLVFESLMKSIIGRYMLTDDYKKEYTLLPEDFIDLDNKTIIWHSDSGTDNVLTLHYEEEKTITITISKDKNASEHVTNAVRIRTSGSNYAYYYQEFTSFFRALCILEAELNKTAIPPKQVNQNDPKQKKLSFLKRFIEQKKN